MKPQNSFFKNLSYYRGPITRAILLVGLVLGLIGTWQVHAAKYTGLKLVSILFYDTIKLFSFGGLVSISETAPLAYELARWIAPFGTVLGFLAIFDKAYKKLRSFFSRWRKDKYLLLGWNQQARLFAGELLKRKPKPEVICIVPRSDSTALEDEIEEYGLVPYVLDYETPELMANAITMRGLARKKPLALVSFEPEPSNYAHLLMLAKIWPSDQSALPVYLAYQNKTLRDFIRPQLDELKTLNLHYFSIEENQAISLFTKEGMQFSARLQEAGPDQEITPNLGSPHLLLVGFDALGQRMLEVAINQSLGNLKDLPRVTLLGDNVATRLDQYRGNVPELDKAAIIQTVNGSISSQNTRSTLTQINASDPFDLIIYTQDNAEINVLHASELLREFPGVACAIYAPDFEAIKPLADALKSAYPQVKYFGDLQTTLAPKTIFNEQLYQAAKRFNHAYNLTAVELGGGPVPQQSQEEAWQSLSALNKESSLYLAMSLPVKARLIQTIAAGQGISAQDLLKTWKGKLTGLSTAGQVDHIAQDELMNWVTALEHKRWNSFYYLRGFRFGAKNIPQKLHDCLIDSWQEFLGSVQREKAIYDFISYFNLIEN